jgi:hypothetical protein
MYPTKEIADGGADPGIPTVAEMRESQRKGSTGIGMAPESFCDQMKDFDQGAADCPNY